MTDNASYTWRYVRLDQIMPTSRLIDDLHNAGYYTAGDVLDSDPEDIAEDVYGIGPKRAIWLRQKVFDYVKPFGSQSAPQWVLVTPEPQPAPPTSSAASWIATACVGVAIGLLVYLTLRWLT